jgi:predicted amidohydrolase
VTAGAVTPARLRVAAVQAKSVAGDVERNVATAVEWVVAAAARGAQVVVLPELFLGGYDPDTWRHRPDSDVHVNDPRLAPLVDASRACGAVALVGAAVRDRERRHISMLGFAPHEGAFLAYSKQHLWSDERSVFSPGRAGSSLEVGGWQLGLGICYDGCFPEHARAAVEAGAVAYVCPSAYVVGSEHRRDLYYAARALDNGIYVVMAGLVGGCGELTFSGGTAIYDPQGRCVADVRSGPGIAVADLDCAAVTEARAINPYAADRLASLGGHTQRVVELSKLPGY